MKKPSTPKTKTKTSRGELPLPEGIIRFLKQGNQRRPGTKAAKRYALYKEGMTVAECIAAGKKAGVRMRRVNIRTDVQRGNIAVDLPKAKPAKPTKAAAKPVAVAKATPKAEADSKAA